MGETPRSPFDRANRRTTLKLSTSGRGFWPRTSPTFGFTGCRSTSSTPQVSTRTSCCNQRFGGSSRTSPQHTASTTRGARRWCFKRTGDSATQNGCSALAPSLPTAMSTSLVLLATPTTTLLKRKQRQKQQQQTHYPRPPRRRRQQHHHHHLIIERRQFQRGGEGRQGTEASPYETPLQCCG